MKNNRILLLIIFLHETANSFAAGSSSIYEKVLAKPLPEKAQSQVQLRPLSDDQIAELLLFSSLGNIDDVNTIIAKRKRPLELASNKKAVIKNNRLQVLEKTAAAFILQNNIERLSELLTNVLIFRKDAPHLHALLQFIKEQLLKKYSFDEAEHIMKTLSTVFHCSTKEILSAEEITVLRNIITYPEIVKQTTKWKGVPKNDEQYEQEYQACRKRYSEALKHLQAHLNKQLSFTLYLKCLASFNKQAFEQEIRRGEVLLPIEVQDIYGQNEIHKAAATGNNAALMQCALFFTAHCIQLNEENRKKAVVPHNQSLVARLERINTFKQQWRQLLAKRNAQGETALHSAAANGNLSATQCLKTIGSFFPHQPLFEIENILTSDAIKPLTNDIQNWWLTSVSTEDRNNNTVVQTIIESLIKALTVENNQAIEKLLSSMELLSSTVEKTKWEELLKIQNKDERSPLKVISHFDLSWLRPQRKLENPQEVKKEDAPKETPKDENLSLVHILVMKKGITAESIRVVLRLFPACKEHKNDNGQTPLHTAVIAGITSHVECLLASKAQIDAIDKKGRTPLHYAAVIGNTDLVKKLRSHAQSISKECLAALDSTLDNDGLSPLHLAAAENHVSCIRAFDSVDIKGKNNITPLHCAAILNQVNALEALCNKVSSEALNAYVNAFCGSDSALEHAVKHNSIDAVRFLRSKDATFYYALRYAVEECLPEMVTCLIDLKANLEQTFTVNGKSLTPFLIAWHLYKQDKEKVFPFIWFSPESPLEIEHKNLIEKRKSLLYLLKKHNANIDVRDSDGHLLLINAIEEGNERDFDLLCYLGASHNSKDSQDWAPLHYAAKKGNLSIVKKLIARGANTEQKNDKGRRAIEVAYGYSKKDIVDYFKTEHNQSMSFFEETILWMF